MNKTILITGAAKRIGKEIALTYCELGWNIIIHYNSSYDSINTYYLVFHDKYVGKILTMIIDQTSFKIDIDRRFDRYHIGYVSLLKCRKLLRSYST